LSVGISVIVIIQSGKTVRQQLKRIRPQMLRYLIDRYHFRLFLFGLSLFITIFQRFEHAKSVAYPVADHTVLFRFRLPDRLFPFVHFASSIPRSFCSASFRSRTTSPLFSQRRRGAGFWPSRSRRTS